MASRNVSNSAIIAAVKKHGFNLDLLSKQLGAPPSVIHAKIKSSPELQHKLFVPAIMASGGLPAAIGDKLGMTRSAVAKKIEASSEFQNAIVEAHEQVNDAARAVLIKGIQGNNVGAAARHLRDFGGRPRPIISRSPPKKAKVPVKYSDALANKILLWISEGKALTQFCKLPNTPGYDTIMQWLLDKEDFCRRYTIARDRQGDYDADRITEVIDKIEYENMDPNAAKVIISALQWTAARRAPKRYSDKYHNPEEQREDAVGLARRIRSALDEMDETVPDANAPSAADVPPAPPKAE